jgi:dihydrofolate reductase
MADRLYISRIEAVFQADTFFPNVDWSNWVERSAIHHPADAENQHPVTFCIYDRKIS